MVFHFLLIELPVLFKTFGFRVTFQMKKKRVKTEYVGYLNNNNFEDISSSGREKLILLHQIQDKVD